MSIMVVQKQMLIIFAMILIGFWLFKKKHLSDGSVKDISWLIVNITNPITLLCAALREEEKVSPAEVGMAFLIFAVMYALLILSAYLIPMLLRVERSDRYAYRMMAIFGNVGFIGIPFANAVLGPKSLIFVSICGLTFNAVFYTYGMADLSAAARSQNPGAERAKMSLRQVVNSGTILAIITIVVYVGDVRVPESVQSFLTHIGNCTTFMSMVVLGVSVAKMVPREVFSNWRLYAFTLLRQIGVPIVVVWLLKPFVASQLLLSTIAVMITMPAANLPLMTAKILSVKDDTISAGIILTTVASIITIPIVMVFVPI